jgi:hypothetical protein
MSAVIQVPPDCLSRGAAQPATTCAKAVSARTTQPLLRNRRRRRLGRRTPSVRNTARRDGLHHRIGSPSQNHGKIPLR